LATAWGGWGDHWGEDDYSVLDQGRSVGRIYKEIHGCRVWIKVRNPSIAVQGERSERWNRYQLEVALVNKHEPVPGTTAAQPPRRQS
jgi:hypothetical protein